MSSFSGLIYRVLIWSIRAKWEGGEYKGSEESRQDILRMAYDLGADYIDVELKVCGLISICH